MNLKYCRSVEESLRMIQYICSIKPRNVKETLSINNAKRNIHILTQPLADISKNIADFVKECELRKQKIKQFDGSIKDLERELYIPVVEIKSTPLDKPKTVCSDADCCDYENIDVDVKKIYRTTCHSPCYLDNDDYSIIGNTGLLDCKAFNEYIRTGI